MRVGAVNYLNSKPLIHELERLAPQIELSLDLPSRLADRMAAGELDVGLIPAVEYLRAGDYSLIPGIAIATHGPVLSVTLFSRVPWSDIMSLALDEGSRTSASLAQVILRHRYGVRPELEPLPIEADPEAVTTDAVLLIGDRAMHACLAGFPHAYDLGEEWTEWTGLPFVFAAWAVRPGVELGGAAGAFHEAKRLGLAHAGVIAQREAVRLGLGAGYCRRYLTNVIRYDLGPRELRGLQRFADLAAAIGLVPDGVNVDGRDRACLVEGR